MSVMPYLESANSLVNHDAQDAVLEDLHFVLSNLRGSDEDSGAVVEVAED